MRLYAILAVVGVAIALQLDVQLCNGKAELCHRRYSNVSLIGTHNAPFVGEVTDPRVNQEKTVKEQLDAGIRFLTGQVHKLSSELDIPLEPFEELQMCHTSCALWDAGKLVDYLSTVKEWVDAHPDEVVTLLLGNGDYDKVTTFEAAFDQSGIKDLAFIPATTPQKIPMDGWPTYAEMIASGKRVVVFMDYKADETQVPYILDEFTYFFETPFDPTDLKQCNLDRPANGSADGRMYIVNHSLNKGKDIKLPDWEADYRVNAATGEDSIGAQSSLCTSKWGRAPSVVLVDRFNRGDVFTAQNALNGITSA